MSMAVAKDGVDSRRELSIHVISRIVGIVHPIQTLGDGIVLIVPRKDDHGWMVPEASDDLLGFSVDALVEFLVRGVL